MSKFTPGPWFSPDGKTIKQDYRPIGLSEDAGCMIGAVMGGSTSGPAFVEIDEEVAANTKLICAAPDLLEALEGLLDNEKQASFEFWLSRNSPSGDCDSVHSQWLESSEYHDFLDLYDSEIAAITKARGES